MSIEMDVRTLQTFYAKGQTKSLKFRIEQLNRLEKAVYKFEDKILDALKKDLNKSAYEAYLTEVTTVLMEIKFVKKNLRKWVKPKKVKTPLTHFPAKSYVYSEPYGVVLIMSPWNYPFQLTIMPLVGAIAAGNCALIKPSNYSTHTSLVVEELINETFAPDFVKVVLGGREENSTLLNQKFDLIFFTGSVNVGKIVMEAASKNLTPVVLELGGKSPCIVDESADLKLAAKRIIWGKMLNAGQTCVAPDYLLVHSKVKDVLVKAMASVLELYYHPNNIQFIPTIINEHHFKRLSQLLENTDILIGGKTNDEKMQIEGTLVNANWYSEIMKEEIFGPILPIITYDDLDEVITKINSHPKPLALYLFTNNKVIEKTIINNISFGGGCINDTIMHLASPYLAFGGVGESGMGSYHGVNSFNTFSHKKSILKKSRFFDIPLRYPPYDKKLGLLKRVIK